MGQKPKAQSVERSKAELLTKLTDADARKQVEEIYTFLKDFQGKRDTGDVIRGLSSMNDALRKFAKLAVVNEKHKASFVLFAHDVYSAIESTLDQSYQYHQELRSKLADGKDNFNTIVGKPQPKL